MQNFQQLEAFALAKKMHVHDYHMDNTKLNASLFCSVWSPLHLVNLIFNKHTNLIFNTHIKESLQQPNWFTDFFTGLLISEKKRTY